MLVNYNLLVAFLASCLISGVVNAQDASSVVDGASSLASEAGAGATSLASDAGDVATSLGGVATSAAASATWAAGDGHTHDHMPTPTGAPMYPSGSAWPSNGIAPGANATGLPLSQSNALPSPLPAFGLVASLAIVLSGVLHE